MNKEIFIQPFQELWTTVATELPRILVALLVFIIGWIVAQLVYKLVRKALDSINLDKALESTGLSKAVEKSGHKLNTGRIIGFLAKWFIIIGFLMLSLNLLGLEQTQAQLAQIASLIPSVVLAAFILFAGVVLANFVKKLVRGSSSLVNFKSAGLLGSIAKVGVLVFTVLIVLSTLGIGEEIILPLYIGIVAMFALAGGLAFGLGGRDAAAKVIENFKDSIEK